MRKVFVIKVAVILIAILGLIAIGIILWKASPPSYLSLAYKRDATYYSQIADGCEALITQVSNTNGVGLHLNGNDARLPETLLQIKSDQVDVFSNRVNIFVNAPARYSVGWERDDQNSLVWHLRLYGEGEPRLLLTRTNHNRKHD